MRTVLQFSELEVLAFFEDMIRSGEANNEELRAYEDYQWFGRLNKNTYDKLVKKMKKIWKQVY
ncbi:hypothetical protein [Heyndrickxia camelliae]|uniref:Uncharacterized protein n=1 Tax=Heyndrickxia camelliae TaxID=1707093 RepID=A0A2N3LE47_9BACI|nr:hypothetical protein [Heyndrickxia camelliae]PKR82869.1 hypothetical protein CWO92_22020 [Heyndrickxia camelliae]